MGRDQWGHRMMRRDQQGIRSLSHRDLGRNQRGARLLRYLGLSCDQRGTRLLKRRDLGRELLSSVVQKYTSNFEKPIFFYDDDVLESPNIHKMYEILAG